MEFWHNKNKRSPSIREQKTEIREHYLKIRKEIPEQTRKEFDRAICEKIKRLVSYRHADIVLSYSPLRYEVNVSDINRHTIQNQKILGLPKCLPGAPLMEFKQVKSLDDLEKGNYSICEPKESCPPILLSAQNNPICIIPAVVFDKKGFRIGYGKGYYDRFLGAHNITKIGVAYSQFITDDLPQGRYDLAVDVIVTESKIITVKK